MLLRLRAYRSPYDTAWENLAWEEHLLATRAPDEALLLFTTNRPAVVIGKHQNPWVECDLERLAADGVALARRCSGGGAVYHDLGNLNYSVLLPRERHDREAIMRAVVAALVQLRLPAELGPRHTVVVAGRKVSGTAFCLKRLHALHHGTLLLHADLARLHRYLRQRPSAIVTRATASVPAPVTNLTEYRADLTADLVAEALCASLAALLDCAVPTLAPLPPAPPAWADLVARHRSPAWQYDETPPFAWPWPLADGQAIELHVRAGRVAELAGPAPDWLCAAWTGCPFRAPDLAAALTCCPAPAAAWARHLRLSGLSPVDTPGPTR
jgi:lipoate-protein ligase A